MENKGIHIQCSPNLYQQLLQKQADIQLATGKKPSLSVLIHSLCEEALTRQPDVHNYQAPTTGLHTSGIMSKLLSKVNTILKMLKGIDTKQLNEMLLQMERLQTQINKQVQQINSLKPLSDNTNAVSHTPNAVSHIPNAVSHTPKIPLSNTNGQLQGTNSMLLEYKIEKLERQALRDAKIISSLKRQRSKQKEQLAKLEKKLGKQKQYTWISAVLGFFGGNLFQRQINVVKQSKELYNEGNLFQRQINVVKQSKELYNELPNELKTEVNQYIADLLKQRNKK